ncbi:MAG: adenosylcobalamin-dependent ribonucleoside-diphosphate reductase [Proteobacteria bacterium]|nr:adenosylcobalamin-dependent ribonucleoside-diphosphate reductase [Pseudomonadota bacterium]
MPTVSAIAQQIWDMKYRFKAPDGTALDESIEDSWQRVAGALAEAEQDPAAWALPFREALEDFRFLPAGRILAGAGTGRDVTLFNCFVMGEIPDDMTGIFEHLKEAALTLQRGGGIGYDFSTLRPRGAPVHGVGADASGPLSFMDVWDAMCRTIMSAGYRRGAMMATLRCDHPDIQDFVRAKAEPGRLRMFNLSILVTDDFMTAVREDADWPLVFGGKTFSTLRARDLWNEIMRATYDYAEPGVIFIDRINHFNNLHYIEEIYSTNPCGEQPLPPYGACLLGSINLARLVREPFTKKARLDVEAMERLIPTALRMLDNAIDVSRFALEKQREEAVNKRRVGLGVTGLGDALIMCRVAYGSAKAVKLTETWMAAFRNAAYRASIELAKEKGPFPLFDRDKYLAGATIATLPADIRDAIAEHGIRNALVTSIAPTGTISLLADNVSSGIEPVFSYRFTRAVLMPDGSHRDREVVDYAAAAWWAEHGDEAELPDYFVDSRTLAPEAHIVMQAAVQKYIDSSISKTVNLPDDIPFEDFKDVYLKAYEMGCKGCTTYRPNLVTGAVLTADEKGQEPVAKGVDEHESASDIVYMTQPLERPEALVGKTYKLRWPESDHAFYLTVNDIIQDGRRRPFEVFINSANLEHYAWTVALTRMISAVFRRGGDVTFVVRELKSIFDPRGGYWMEGRYVPSLLAALGEVMEQHMIDIGFISEPEAEALESLQEAVGESAARFCPKCSQPGLVRREGCDLCLSCGYSKCS